MFRIAYPQASVDPMILDLASFASIREFAKNFNAKYEVLDSLILNAGIMVPPFQLTKDGLESQIGINHFVKQRLIRQLAHALFKNQG